MLPCFEGRGSSLKFCTKDTLSSSVSIWQRAGKPDLVLLSFHTSDVSDFRKKAKPESKVFQLSVCDHNLLMQNGPRTTLIRAGVRQKIEDLCKLHLCNYNELLWTERFLLQGFGEMLLPFYDLQGLNGILQCHWGNDLFECNVREAESFLCCQASFPFPVLQLIFVVVNKLLWQTWQQRNTDSSIINNYLPDVRHMRRNAYQIG